MFQTDPGQWRPRQIFGQEPVDEIRLDLEIITRLEAINGNVSLGNIRGIQASPLAILFPH